jgi:quinol monooxygenase YgiN
MKKLRYNIFNHIHKELRMLLYDTAHAIEHTDFRNETAALQAFGRMDETLRLFDVYTHTEEEHLFPLLNAFAPDIVMDFEQQHQHTNKLSAALRQSIQSYNPAADNTTRQQSGARALKAFAEFTAFNLQHMNKDEAVINEALWQHYADQDLVALEKTMIDNVPPERPGKIY